MSVTTYDSSFSYRQDQVARFGDRGAKSTMTEEDRRRFQESPFMQRMREIDEKAWQQFSQRDKKRQQSDPNFQPKDTDFEAPKAFKYDKSVNYYKTLGVDEYATSDEIKKAYRKLSLAYHPDKQTGKSQEEKDEAAATFMEIKNAYKTLADDPTRRQYDFERDRDLVSAESHNKKRQEKDGFDAREALTRILQKAKENKKTPSEIVTVPIHCRLEKFVFGGQKAIKRTRLVKDKNYGGYKDDLKIFRVDLPPGAEQPWAAEFRRQGDQHESQEADTLRFLFSAKSHPRLDRNGQDLVLRDPVPLGSHLRVEPYLSASVPVFAGRHLLIWGQNPFYGSEALAEEAELELRLRGLGVGASGLLVLRLKLDLGKKMPEGYRRNPEQPRPGRRQFIERFGLGPPGGFVAGETFQGTSVASSSSMQRRQERRDASARSHAEAELRPLGESVSLFTKPPSSMTFLAGSPSSGPPSLFAVGLDCPVCGKKKGVPEWERLKARLLSVIQHTAFILLGQARSVRPKSLLRKPVFDDRTGLPRMEPSVPWKSIGDDAFKHGNFWIACSMYAKRLAELHVRVPQASSQDADGQSDSEEVVDLTAPGRGPDQIPEAAKVLSNRAACLIRLRDYEAALAHARKATELAPRWARPWTRLGQAAWELGGELRREAVDAYAKAVEMDPSVSNMVSLQKSVRELEGPSADAAHAAKEEGNTAARGAEFGLAIAMYTRGIARLPPPATAEGAERPDEHALLRGVLFSNRSMAFSRICNWDAAVADGKEAVSAQPNLVSAHSQLGVALLGSGSHQEAYVEFARAVQLDSEHKFALKGRHTCLKEMVLWKSTSATARYKKRFWLDSKRPRGSSRVFAISDLHFDQRYNEDWAHAIDDIAFLDDVLIVAGNVADSKVGVQRALTTLKSKFRRVFYTVGNHEMQIQISEIQKIPDSFAKFHAIFDMCDELGIDVFPAPVCEGLLVMPLLSWCTAEFDKDDPFPDPNGKFNQRCVWPMDADMQVWKYMMKLNEPFLSLRGYDTVITFSHFLPRPNLPFDKSRKNAIKVVGCDMIDEQARAVKSKLHVYGHGRVRCAQTHNGVRYVSAPVGFEADWPKDHPPRLMLVHNGKALCMEEWGTDDEPPLGYVKRILHLTFYAMPDLREAELRKIQNALQRIEKMPGILASFERLGSRKDDKGALAKDAWPELAQLSQDASHALMVVADDLASLKELLHSEAYARDWSMAVSPHVRSSLSFSVPLGLDFWQAKKKDPTLMVVGLSLSSAIKEDSDEYLKMLKASDAINKLPGIDGKLAVALQPLGWDRFSHGELLEELGVSGDRSAGLTHCFLVLVDEPSSYKMLAQSKTFGKWKASYEPHLNKFGADRKVVGFAVPVEIAATAAAPKAPPKKDKSATGTAKR